MSIDNALRIAVFLFVIACLAGICEEARCQTVSFSPQGAEVLKAMMGRAVPGIAALGVEVCSQSDQRISAGRIYQTAITVGYEPRSPLVIDALMSAELGRNWRRLLAESLNLGTHAGAGLTASGIIKASSAWTTGLIAGAQLLDTVADRLRARLPSGTWRRDLLEGDLDLKAGGCVEKLMFARYHPDIVPRTASLDPLPDVIVPFRPERRR